MLPVASCGPVLLGGAAEGMQKGQVLSPSRESARDSLGSRTPGTHQQAASRLQITWPGSCATRETSTMWVLKTQRVVMPWLP